MNFARYVGVSIASLLLAVPLSAAAATFSLFAKIDGVQAGTSSGGSGTGVMDYDDGTNTLKWNISFSGLEAGTTAAHFHGPAAPGMNAGIQVTIPLGASANMTSGNLLGSATITDAQAADLLSKLWYINIHSAKFGSGEIRGQVEVVPLPAALWLLGSALVGLFGYARRYGKA